METMGSPQVSSSPLFSILVFEAGPLTRCRSHRWLELWAASPQSLLPLSSAGVKVSAITHGWVFFFHMVVGHLNSGPHAYIATSQPLLQYSKSPTQWEDQSDLGSEN